MFSIEFSIHIIDFHVNMTWQYSYVFPHPMGDKRRHFSMWAGERKKTVCSIDCVRVCQMLQTLNTLINIHGILNGGQVSGYSSITTCQTPLPGIRKVRFYRMKRVCWSTA